jgi:hypothetical protein
MVKDENNTLILSAIFAWIPLKQKIMFVYKLFRIYLSHIRRICSTAILLHSGRQAKEQMPDAQGIRLKQYGEEYDRKKR